VSPSNLNTNVASCKLPSCKFGKANDLKYPVPAMFAAVVSFDVVVVLATLRKGKVIVQVSVTVAATVGSVNDVGNRQVTLTYPGSTRSLGTNSL